MCGVPKNLDFEKNKTYLARNYLHEFDQKITGGKIHKLTKATSGIEFDWRLRFTAKYAEASCVQKLMHTYSTSGELIISHGWKVTIKLSSQLLKTEQKLRDVLAHEYYHLLDKMLPRLHNSPLKDRIHGPSFRYWAIRVGRGFPYLSIHIGDCQFRGTYTLQCIECETQYILDVKIKDPFTRRCAGCAGHVVEI